MISYLDASVVVATLIRDDHLARLSAWLATAPQVRFSAWTITEASSALSHRSRLQQMTLQERARAEAALDAWAVRKEGVVPVISDDFAAARKLTQRHGLLRAGDALHLAVAIREKLAMATFDVRLADVARAEGVVLSL